MRNYWSCSRLADLIRGTPTLKAGSSKQWKEWRATAEAAHPIRYWFTEEVLDKVQNIIWWPIDQLHTVKYYINNRWVTQTHALAAHPRDIPRGEWREYGTRILPCLFNELVNFVEIDQAAMNIIWDVEARKKYNAPWWSFGWFRIRTWRSKESGLEYLNWAASLTNEEWLGPKDAHLAEPTHQAKAAMEIISLYHWWTEVRPNRLEPYDASGWTALCEQWRLKSADNDLLGFLDIDNETLEENLTTTKALDICRELEEKYEAEDTEMLIRLIKIRDHLWT